MKSWNGDARDGTMSAGQEIEDWKWMWFRIYTHIWVLFQFGHAALGLDYIVLLLPHKSFSIWTFAIATGRENVHISLHTRTHADCIKSELLAAVLHSMVDVLFEFWKEWTKKTFQRTYLQSENERNIACDTSKYLVPHRSDENGSNCAADPNVHSLHSTHCTLGVTLFYSLESLFVSYSDQLQFLVSLSLYREFDLM